VRLDNARDGVRRTGRLERHLIVRPQAPREQLKLLDARPNPPRRADLTALLLDRDLAEVAVDIQRYRAHVASSQMADRGRRSGQNDTDGSVLAAQPDKSQGRPVSRSGSQPIP
jgi:stalled ribosome rescue protein Dom34